MEIWKTVPEFEDYEVSNLGRVRSIRPRKGSRANINNGIATGWIQYARPNYPRRLVSFRKKGRTYIKKVHRVVLEAFVCPCPENMESLHINGDSLDNRLSNLRWGTHEENCIDTVVHGKKTNPPVHWGDKHHNATLTTEQVELIRSHTFRRGDQAALARRFGVADITVHRIRKGQARTRG